jgi:hypothetical protein
MAMGSEGHRWDSKRYSGLAVEKKNKIVQHCRQYVNVY